MEFPGTAAGIALLGVQTCQSIASYYYGWKNCPADVCEVYDNIAALVKTFTVLQVGLLDPSSDDGKDIQERRACKAAIATCLSSCKTGLDRLQEVLSSLQSDGGPREMSHRPIWAEECRALYVFHENTIAEVTREANELRNSFSPVLQTLLDSSFNYAINGRSEFLTDKKVAGAKIGPALYCASWIGIYSQCESLLKQGADINACGGKYGNALQAASASGHLEIVKLLLAAGADVNAQGGHYYNALHAASEEGHQQIAKLLLDAGADANAHIH